MHLIIERHPRRGWRIRDTVSGSVSSKPMSLRQAKAAKEMALEIMALVLADKEKGSGNGSAKY